MTKRNRDRPLDDAQEIALAAVADEHDKGRKRVPLWAVRDLPPYADGRTLTSLVRRGLLERREPERPLVEPSYVLTGKGREMLRSMGD